MKEKYSIGDVSNATGVTITALRYYEKKGLLIPNYIDKETHYRYYSIESFWMVEIIKMCKKLGFPLNEIKRIKENGDIKELLGFVEVLKDKIVEEKKLLDLKYNDLNWLQSEWNSTYKQKVSPQRDPIIKHIKEQNIIVCKISELDDKYKDEDLEYKAGLLHKNFQTKYKQEIIESDSIQIKIGYELSVDKFLNKELDILYEYASMAKFKDDKKMIIEKIPEGNYLCYKVEMWNDKEWIDKLNNYIKENELIPLKIYIEELAFYFFDYKKIVHEIKILI